MDKIRIAISGYGNIGRGVELAVRQNEDMELVAIVTRRNPAAIKPIDSATAVVGEQDVKTLCDKVDVMILCGGSATDLPEQGPRYASMFHTVDSFDTHAAIPAYFDKMDASAQSGGKLSLISCGWDPGLFSVLRAYGEAVLPHGQSDTFWGRGVSQGHSDALRRLPGVADAIQYTVPIEAAVEAVRNGLNPTLAARQKHLRSCFVVAKEGEDQAAIETAIKKMPNYFADYDTTVEFVSRDTLKAEHSTMPHGGFVFRSGETGVAGMHHVMEFSLKLDSNPEFTGSVLAAFARATFRMAKHGQKGCVTVLDIPPAWLSAKSGAQLRQELL